MAETSGKGLLNSGPNLRRDKMGNSRAVAAAQRHLLPALHQDKGVSLMRTGADLFHMLKIHNRRPMDAEEVAGVQFGFEGRPGLAQEVIVARGADANVVLLRSNPVNVGDGEKQDSSSRLENQTGFKAAVLGWIRGRSWSGLVCANLLPGALQRFGKPCTREGLEQVVNRVDLERPERVLVVCGRKDDARQD